MNILVLSPFFPYPLAQGGKIRIFNILKHLSRNHQVTLACLSGEDVADYGPLRDYCEEILVVPRRPALFADLARFLLGKEPFNFLKFSSGKMRAALEGLIGRKSFDLVQIEFSMMWQYAGIFKGRPVVLDAHNIDSAVVGQLKETARNPLKKLLYAREEKRFRQREEKVWRECDICFAVSDNERDVISTYRSQPGSVWTIPNGVDLERFEFRPKAAHERRMLFIGGFEYQPNFDSAIFLLREILPLIRARVPDAKLDIVGRQLHRIRAMAGAVKAELHEDVPDVRPFFRKADLLVVPLRQGAGTRIKILEAMAAGLPVVTTTKGCEGIHVRHKEHLLIADSADTFASAVLAVLEDDRRRQSIAGNARRLVEERYSWEKIAGEMEKQYEKTVNSK
jgi:sugar transferase (PEP-CTERM/EpsH1 system associated)